MSQMSQMKSTTAKAFDTDTPSKRAQHQPHLTLAQSETRDTLRNCVRRSLADYFQHLDGEDVNDLYQIVLAEMEIPMLEKVLEFTRGNQTRASKVLGLNRGTLRKKLKQYNML